MATRVGVDVGGTFTDVVFYDDGSGEVRIGKVPTVPDSPEQGVEASISTVLDGTELAASEYFLHGTTVGLNTILQRSGPAIGMLCTRGFRDVLEIRRTERDDPYGLFAKPVSPLVPRKLRLPVTERLLGSGEVLTPLDPADVRDALDVFERAGVATVAIAFLHAYANPEHELEAARILREAGFDGEISLSHLVSGEYREYERTATTVVDAYLRPSMRAYLGHLEHALGDAGYAGELRVVRPDGGAITFHEAAERPFETILSGPVGGVQGAGELARDLALEEVITADVGGTSFDTALVSDGDARLLYEGAVAGMPIQAAWVDVRSIGAGGGSIAYVDDGGLLRVGPRSAGAYPGPACYGRGGVEPTVTDAALLLGMLPAELASGLRPDSARAEDALATLAGPLELDVAAVARGVMVIASAAMAGTMREITVQQGRDPRAVTLMAFGGAGPLFATLLARELEIPRIVIPPYPGNFSAWGMLGADLVRTATRTRVMALTDAVLEEARGIFEDLFSTIEARTRPSDRERVREIAFDMRYKGQEHTVTVSAPSNGGQLSVTADGLVDRFTETYTKTFAYTLEFEPEIVTLRATEREPLPRRKAEVLRSTATNGSAEAPRMRAYSFSEERWLDFAHIERAGLERGAVLEGPVIVGEETATTYIDAGFSATVDETGALFVTMSER